LTRRVFARLLGLLVLLLVIQTAVMEFVFIPMLSFKLLKMHFGPALRTFSPFILLSGLIALIFAIVLAVWASHRVNARIDCVVGFSRRMAEGDLNARAALDHEDELVAIEAALNNTAERLGQSVADIESRRQELAAMLDSMQEGVVAITPDGLVRWWFCTT
jgi:two-component system phosphate regulon sensor histidine kinase PhoR